MADNYKYVTNSKGERVKVKVSRAEQASNEIKSGTGPNAETEVGKNRQGAEKADITGKVNGAVIANQAANNTTKEEATDLVKKLTNQAKKEANEREAYDKAQTQPNATQETVVKKAEEAHKLSPEEGAKQYDANHTPPPASSESESDDTKATEIVEASGTSEDGSPQPQAVDNPEATDEEKQEEADKAKDYAFNNGLMNEDGTFNKDAIINFASQSYHEPSTLMKILNVIGGLIHAATLGIVPRVDFMKLTGTTDVLGHINDDIDKANEALRQTATNANQAQINAYEDSAKKRTAYMTDKLNAGETTDEDIANASKLGQFTYQVTGNAAKDSSALEGELKKMGLSHEYARDMAELANQYTQAQMELQSRLRQAEATHNNTLTKDLLQAQVQTKIDFQKKYTQMAANTDPSDRNKLAQYQKAQGGTTNWDALLDHIDQSVGILTKGVDAAANLIHGGDAE